MEKTLVIVESPNKIKKIQSILGEKYIVKASVGHITDLIKGGPHGIGIDIQNGFKPKYAIMQDKVAVVNELMKAAAECDEVLIFSDPDREGESIAWHLRERLKDVGKPIKRSTFKEITKKEITKALKNLRDVDEDLVASQEARRILDRIVGFMVSPYLINTFNDKLSAGRVQSVVTKMIIDRENEINSFVSEDFWTLQAELVNSKKESVIFKYENKILDEEFANELESKLKSSTYTIEDVISSEEKKNPPPPLITSTLQQIMSKQFGMSPDKTMKAAQSLYEFGYVSYIRTDSVRTEDDALNNVRDYITNTLSKSVPTKPNVFKNKDASQDAHECIRPTDLSLIPNNNHSIIDSDEKKVYEMIWKYFIASQMTPAIFDTLKIIAHCDLDPTVKLKVSGKAIKDKGYLELLGSSAADKIDLPLLKVGDKLSLKDNKSVLLEKKKTQPPPRFAEDILLKELEKKEIGRPATYAEILTKITNRDYVVKKGNVYHPTDLGKKITQDLSKFFTFMDYDYTAKMEKNLDQIAEKKKDKVSMLQEFFDQFKVELNNAYVSHGNILCDKCGMSMIVRKNKEGKEFYACSQFPKCKNAKSK